MLKSQSDNKQAGLQKLYSEYAPTLIRFACKYVGPGVAEDIVQEAFLKLMRKDFYTGSYEQTRSLMFVIVKNECIDHIRRNKLRRAGNELMTEQLRERELEYHETMEEALISDDTVARIMSAAERLPQKRREVFFAYYREGRKIAEIAQSSGSSERTVENHIYRALVYLREICKIF